MTNGIASSPKESDETGRLKNGNGVTHERDTLQPQLLPADYSELYVVITEGRDDFVNFARLLRAKLKDVFPGGEATVLIASTAFNAIRIVRSYGHVPLVMIIGDMAEGGQALPAHGFVSAAYENMAIVTNPLILKIGDREYRHVDKLAHKTTLDLAVQTILWERQDTVLPVRQRVLNSTGSTGIDSLILAIERQFDKALNAYPSLTQAIGKPPRIVKIGGSMYDLYETQEGGDIFTGLVQGIAEIIKEGSYNIILTVGGGPSYEPAKQATAHLQISPEQQKRMARVSFRQQAATTADLLTRMGVPSQIVSDTKTLQYVESLVRSGNALPSVPIVLNIPNSYPGANFYVPPERSDELAVALADLIGEPGTIFVKDTDGVYIRDPRLLREQVEVLPKSIRGQNNRLIRVYPEDFLSRRISRLGPDGRDQHLVEDSALHAMRQSIVVGYIQVVNGRNPADVRKAITTIQPVGAYILNQNVKLDPAQTL